MILVSKFIVHKALSDKTYLSLGLLSALILNLNLNNVVGELSQKMLLNCSEIYVFELFSL